MSNHRSTFVAVRRSILGGACVLGWLGFGAALGWALTWSLKSLNDLHAGTNDEPAIIATIASAIGLCLFVAGSRALVREVRNGVHERRGEAPPARRGLALLLAPLAAPIIGMVIALFGVPNAHGVSQKSTPPGISVPAADAQRRGLATPITHRGRAERTYVVRAGDRITALAKRFYGSADDWTIIAKANLGRVEPDGARFVDPSILRAGWTLVIPPPVHHVPSSRPRSSARAADGSWSRDRALYAALAGFGLLGASLFARRQLRRRRLQRLHSAAGAALPGLLEADAGVELSLRPLERAELPAWIDAANRVLFRELTLDRSILPPHLQLVRAGPLGIELLVEPAAMVTTPSFVSADEGHCWRVDPSLSLEELRARANPDTWSYVPALVPIAEDDDSSYLVALGAGETLGVIGSPDEIGRALSMVALQLRNAPWGEVECYVLGPANFHGAADMIPIELGQLAGLDLVDGPDPLWRDGSFEAQAVVFVENADLAAEASDERRGNVALVGPFAASDRLLFYRDGRVTIEPIGLNLAACLPTNEELDTLERLQANATVEAAVLHEDLATLPPPATEFPAAGLVEVRLLRASPGLVGELQPKLPRWALEFVAYLAAHGNKATTGRLRDALGRYKPDDSLSSHSVWNAAALARKALGANLVPRAVNKEHYSLSSEVTCDWLRFQEMAKIGRAAEIIGEHERAIAALTAALELVEGSPGAEVNYFRWLETEQFCYAIERGVIEAAHRLFNLALGERSFDLARWALEQGRRISTDDGEMRRDAMILADALGDEELARIEFDAGIDALDDLGCGADVDERTERTFIRLGLAKSRARGVVDTTKPKSR